MGAWQSNERGRHLEVKKEVKATELESFHFAMDKHELYI